MKTHGRCGNDLENFVEHSDRWTQHMEKALLEAVNHDRMTM